MANEEERRESSDSSESPMLRQTPIDPPKRPDPPPQFEEHSLDETVFAGPAMRGRAEDETALAMPVAVPDESEHTVLSMLPSETEGIQRTLREFRRNYQRRADAKFGSAVPM